ncbi:MAG: XRE family transcriptional regulator [Spirochaetia bacterium]|nr:XRE family transcriptional regulator [Spirochaetia bacterium]
MLKKECSFGEKIRTVRERRQITLRQVAEAVSISESMVSQIERNKVSPSIDTLLSVAQYLGIDIDYLFSDYKKSGKVIITRKNKGNILKSDSATYSQLCSIPGTDNTSPVEAVWLEIESGKEKGNIEYGHRGSEIGIIIKGEGCLIHGTEQYSLFEGDSISFSSDIPHILRNTGKETLKAIWILSPPRIF